MDMIGRASRRRRLRQENGQALIEVLAILPIFLVITFAVIEFGIGLNYWIDLTHLSNEGARFAAVDRWPGCDDGGCDSELVDYVKSRANTDELKNGGTDSVPDGMCVAISFPDGAEVGDAVKVTVNVTYKLAIVGNLLPGDFGDIDLSSSSTMRLEQPPTQYGETACS
jgi:hypothetical protein